MFTIHKLLILYRRGYNPVCGIRLVSPVAHGMGWWSRMEWVEGGPVCGGGQSEELGSKSLLQSLSDLTT